MTSKAIEKPNPHWLWMEDPRIEEKLAEHFRRFFQNEHNGNSEPKGAEK